MIIPETLHFRPRPELLFSSGRHEPIHGGFAAAVRAADTREKSSPNLALRIGKSGNYNAIPIRARPLARLVVSSNKLLLLSFLSFLKCFISPCRMITTANVLFIRYDGLFRICGSLKSGSSGFRVLLLHRHSDD